MEEPTLRWISFSLVRGAKEIKKPENWVDTQLVPDSTAWKPPEWDDEEASWSYSTILLPVLQVGTHREGRGGGREFAGDHPRDAH